MTIRIIGVSQEDQRNAVEFAKCENPFKLPTVEHAKGDMAVLQVAKRVGMKEEDCKRWLAATFMVLLSFLGLFTSGSPDTNQDLQRVPAARVTRTRRELEV